MFKILIADDERIIREGLMESLPWEELGLSVAAMARDGEEALQMVRETQPDICLLDIMMPVVNGLELLERIREMQPDTICIIVTGYDEFDYAKQALRFQSFDYLLKPIREEELLATMLRAREELEQRRDRQSWERSLVAHAEYTMPLAIQQYLQDCLHRRMDQSATERFLALHGAQMGVWLGVVLVKLQSGAHLDDGFRAWKGTSLPFAIRNILEELLATYADDVWVVEDGLISLVVVLAMSEPMDWGAICDEVERAIKYSLNYTVLLYTGETEEGVAGLPAVYERLMEEHRQGAQHSPLIQQVKQYIGNHYQDPELVLTEVSDTFGVSQGHLSRRIKLETGKTFSELLIEKRIKIAVHLLLEGGLRVNEIADRVGYRSQHYFCAAFKKMTGMSPSEFKERNHL